MKMTLTEKYEDQIKENFGNWIDQLARNHENVGEALAEIWNQYAEDLCNDSIGLLDLTKKEDFATLFIDGRYIEIARETGLPDESERWVMVDNTDNEVIREQDYRFFDEEGLIGLCKNKIVAIADCIIAWPSLYPRDLYEAIIWPIIKAEQLIDLDL